jgi:hypothetical protein
MEPLNPELRKAILLRVPEASPAEIDEYETLLAERFSRDPSSVLPSAEAVRGISAESRLQALYAKLIAPLERGSAAQDDEGLSGAGDVGL